MLNIFPNCKFSTSLPYGLWLKSPRFFVYPLFRLLLCDKRNAGKGCFILGISYASNGSSAKVPKVNHIKIVIFRKNFSHNLINIYIKWLNTFFFWHFDLIYFFAQFSARKTCSKKSFSAYFFNFWCTFWSHMHKPYYQHKRKNPRYKAISHLSPFLVP